MSSGSDNYLRLHGVLLNVLTKVLRQLFVSIAQKDAGCSFHDINVYMQGRKSDLERARNNGKILKYQFENIFNNSSGIVDENKWDVHLLCVLLKVLFANELTSIMDDIETVKEIRNRNNHGANSEIDDNLFRNDWDKLRNATKRLADQAKGTQYMQDMQKEFDNLLTSPMVTKDVLCILADGKREENRREITERLDKISEFCENSEEIIQNNTITSIDSHDVKTENGFTVVQKNLNVFTKSTLHVPRGNVADAVVRETKEIFRRNKFVFLVGSNEDTIMSLVKELCTPYNIDKCVLLRHADGVKYIHMDTVSILIAHFITGQVVFNSNLTDNWYGSLQDLYPVVQSGKMNLVITALTDGWMKAETLYGKHPLFQHKVEVPAEVSVQIKEGRDHNGATKSNQSKRKSPEVTKEQEGIETSQLLKKPNKQRDISEIPASDTIPWSRPSTSSNTRIANHLDKTRQSNMNEIYKPYSTRKIADIITVFNTESDHINVNEQTEDGVSPQSACRSKPELEVEIETELRLEELRVLSEQYAIAKANAHVYLVDLKQQTIEHIDGAVTKGSVDGCVPISERTFGILDSNVLKIMNVFSEGVVSKSHNIALLQESLCAAFDRKRQVFLTARHADKGAEITTFTYTGKRMQTKTLSELSSLNGIFTYNANDMFAVQSKRFITFYHLKDLYRPDTFLQSVKAVAMQPVVCATVSAESVVYFGDRTNVCYKISQTNTKSLVLGKEQLKNCEIMCMDANQSGDRLYIVVNRLGVQAGITVLAFKL